MKKLVVLIVMIVGLVLFSIPVFAQNSHCSQINYGSPGYTTWQVPSGLTQIRVHTIGGGGGGGGSGQGGAIAGQSGRYTVQNLAVSSGETLSIWIGGGGQRGSGGLNSCGGCGADCPGALWSQNRWGYDHLGRGSPYGYGGGSDGSGIGCYWSGTATGGWSGGGGGSSAVVGSEGAIIGGGGYGGRGGYNGGGGYPGGWLSPYSIGGNNDYGGEGGWTGNGGGAGVMSCTYSCDEYGNCGCYGGSPQDGQDGESGYVRIEPLNWNPETNCADSIDNDCDGTTDCADPNCAGLTGPGGVRCCQSVLNCIQQECGIESCNSNVCSATSRLLCDATECAAGKYCETSTGLCKTPEDSSDVCLRCTTDQTSGLSWTTGNHEDAGIGYSAILFDGDGSCTSSLGGDCFDVNNNAVNHKTALTSGSCCGNDANEYYKSDYYGAECTSSLNDCVWSDGNATSSNTGNAAWWCYQHEWNECADSSIGANVGGVTCAGIVGNKAWTIQANVLPENQYSCTDGLDNDGDGTTDCGDPDCDGAISGMVENPEQVPLDGVIVRVLRGITVLETSATSVGAYSISIGCSLPGTYTLSISHPDYASTTRKGIVVNPNEAVTVNFTGANAVPKADACESDCTFPASNIVHSSCDGINGCSFFDALTVFVCDNAQPGWTRQYNSSSTVKCPSGPIVQKNTEKASIECNKKTVVKTTTPVLYKGELIKLAVVSCG